MLQRLAAPLMAAAPFLLAGGINAYADEAPAPAAVIFAPEMNETLKAKEDAFFNALWREFMAPAAPRLTVVPHMRTTHLFHGSDGSCRYPASEKIGQYKDGALSFDDKPLIWSKPFFTMTVRILARQGLKPPSAPIDLVGRSIVVPSGYMFPPAFDGKAATVLQVAAEQKRANMLVSGRVDLMVSSMPTAGFVMRRLSGTGANFNVDLSLDDLPLYFVCHDTPANHALIERFNTGYLRASWAGMIDTLYQRYKDKALREYNEATRAKAGRP